MFADVNILDTSNEHFDVSINIDIFRLDTLSKIDDIEMLPKMYSRFLSILANIDLYRKHDIDAVNIDISSIFIKANTDPSLIRVHGPTMPT